jgi:hypothetical protein
MRFFPCQSSQSGIGDYKCHQAATATKLDQAWLSPSLIQHLRRAALDYSAREENLSDHSILLLDLDLHTSKTHDWPHIGVFGSDRHGAAAIL